MSKLRDDLKTSSIFIIIGVVIFFPTVFLFYVPNEPLHNLGLVLNISYAAIWVYAYTVLKKLLQHSKIKEIEDVLNWVIGILVISTVVSTLISLEMLPEKMGWYLNLIMVLIAGALGILLGVKFLNVKSDLYGKKMALGYLNIFTGVCYASIVLIPLGMVLQLATDIIVATLFDKAAKEIK